jgi:sigma-E factor negative regulatory protein RseB
MYRYGYLLAVDQKTGLLLKSQVMGHDGKVLERFQFADLDVGATPSLEDLAPGDHVAHHPDVAVQDTPDGENTWQIDWIPEGFLPTAADVTMAGQVRTYTDGLAVFSVFLEARQPARNPAAGGEGSAQQGATTAFTRTVKLAGNAWLVTVIGEVPVNTARRVADSVTVPG